MSQRDEQLSALLDNAMDEKELHQFMQDLKQDPLDEAERFHRYQMIGDSLRDDLTQASFIDVSAAVHRAVTQEAPLDTMVSSSTKRFDLSAWFKPLTGMAVAASVAMATVVTVRLVDSEVSTSTQSMANVNQPSAIKSTNVAPVNPVIAQQIRAVSTDANQQQPLSNKQLNDYMMDHSGYAGESTMQGMIPYVRIVIFDDKTKK